MRIRWRDLELPSHVVIDTATQTDTYAKFSVEPFERGFGTTVGNSLRRILLASLEGTAVSSLQIAGIQHEFSSIKGAFEDVTDIVLNVKRLLVQLQGDGPAELSLSAKGKGPVTAGQIKCDQNTEIVNPDLVLATLVDAKAKLDMTLTVKRGRGYVTADDHVVGERQIGVIYVDSSFSPVRRVRYKTEDTRVGKITNYDKLLLEVWTDGTLKPEMALVEAAKILRKHLNPFVLLAEPGPQIPQDIHHDLAATQAQRDQSELSKKLALPVTELDLSVRARNCLDAEGIATLGELVGRSEADMLKVKNFGKTSLTEIKKKLEELELAFGMTAQG